MSEAKACVFCEIAARRVPAQIVDEDDLCLCLLDINPWTEGHCLVVSRRHVAFWHELEEEEVVALFRMAKRVAGRLERVFAPEFVCLYARGRRVPHTHVFLVPTKRGDALDGFFTAIEREQETSPALAPLRAPAALAKAAAKIRAPE